MDEALSEIDEFRAARRREKAAKETVNNDLIAVSMLATYCFLFDGSVMYMLGGMCDGDAWAKFQKTFDSLVSSFKPGHTRF